MEVGIGGKNGGGNWRWEWSGNGTLDTEVHNKSLFHLPIWE